MNMTNYEKIIHDNLSMFVNENPEILEKSIPATKDGDRLVFRASGEECTIEPHQVTFSGHSDHSPRELLITLYARHVPADTV